MKFFFASLFVATLCVPMRAENLSGATVTLPYGELRDLIEAVSLPATDLLVERSDWALVLPATYAPLAVEGNCEFFPGDSKNELRLRKELCRGEPPSVRVFYQKPETTKKP
ncbi:MAG: hypothetical protein WC076_04855 [Terrimicrobiaceae bacterium]|jgi:hypothetical protein|nr:hypothetical protein [Terrimicrobiaceae bacterium]